MAEDSDYLESLYKEVYKAEQDRSDKLDSQINVPTAIVTVLLGAAAIYLERPPRFDGSLGPIAFRGVLLGYAAAVLSAVYCLLRSYIGHRYALIPSPARIAGRVEELARYYRSYYREDEHDIPAGVKTAIQGEMIDFYEQAADANRSTNLTRTSWLYRTTVSLALAFSLLVFSRIIYYNSIGENKPIAPGPQGTRPKSLGDERWVRNRKRNPTSRHPSRRATSSPPRHHHHLRA
jgi:hypothetical protein